MLIAVGLLISGNAKAQNVAKVGAQEYATLDLAWDAVEATGGTIELINDVPNMSDNLVLWHGKTVTLDLGAFNIAANNGFYIAKGQLNVIGSGTINFTCSQPFNVYGSNDANEPYIYSGLMLGKDVTLNATGSGYQYGIAISGIAKTSNAAYKKCGWMTKDENGKYNAFGVQIDIHGTILSHAYAVSCNGQVNKKEGNVPVINIYETASLKDNLDDVGDAGAAIYAAGYCKWNIVGATITGATGIYAKAGVFAIEDANVSATGSYVAPTVNNNGISASGDAMVFDSNGAYAGAIQVTISGETTVSSEHGNAVHEVITSGEESTQSIVVEGGTFTSGESGDAINVTQTGKDGKVVSVEGGEFDSEIGSELLAPGTTPEYNPVTETWSVTPAPSYESRTLNVGGWGTVCYPEQIAYIKGAVAYEFVSNDGSQLGVAAVTTFEAGKAYLINATAAEQSVKYVAETTVTDPVDNNGLVGTFEDLTTTASAWIIKGDVVKPVAAGSSIPANRAYIPVLENVQTKNHAVPARFFALVTTDLVELQGAAKVGKYIEKGKVVILRQGLKYNVIGQEIK